jgi:DNA-binding transcriptional regulator GbsR (MarR family)
MTGAARPAARSAARSAARATARPAAGEVSEFVEEAGLAYGTLGLPRMAGRIVGYLLVCDPPHQTQPDLARELQASKGSISSMLRVLEQIGMVKRVTRPGQRREFVTIPEGAAGDMMLDGMRKTTIVRRLAEQGVRLLRDMPPEQTRRIRELHDLYAFLDREVPALIERWQAQRPGAQKPAPRAEKPGRRAVAKAAPKKKS